MKKQKVGFIGAGKVGTALAARLSMEGYPVIAVADTNLHAAETLSTLVPGCKVFKDAQHVADTVDIAFITTPDDSIAKVASELRWRSHQNVVHCSGADSPDILEPAERYGAVTGSFHPCQAFASVDQAIENVPGSTISIEAPSPLRETLQEMASAIGCDWMVLKPGDKVLYHVAAVFVSNYAVSLLKVATDLFRYFDLTPSQATKVLLPLIQGNINNMKNVGLPHCLTGPIARGDVGTIQRHMSALREREPSLLRLYGELGLQATRVALEKGTIDRQVAERLHALLKSPNQATPQGSIRGSD